MINTKLKTKKNTGDYIKRIALVFTFFAFTLSTEASPLPINSNYDTQQPETNAYTQEKRHTSQTKEGTFSLSVTPFGTAIKLGNSIFYLDRITTHHQQLIIDDFLKKGLFIATLQALVAFGHDIPYKLNTVAAILSIYSTWRFIQTSYFNAQLEGSIGDYIYNFLFSIGYGIIEPLTMLPFIHVDGIRNSPILRLKLLSLSRVFIEMMGLIKGEFVDELSETATQFIPVSLYGDIARLFSIKISYPKSTHDSSKYDIVRLHLGQPTGNGSYQELALVMDELGIDSISIQPVQHIHTQLPSEEQVSHKTGSLVMKFTLPDMDSPSIVDIPLGGESINELILHAMYKKQEINHLPNTRSVLAPDVIQVISDALQFFKQHHDEQTSSYLTYDQGLSASSEFGYPTQTLRDDDGAAQFVFSTSEEDSVSIHWHSGEYRGSVWSGLHLDTTHYGEYSQHVQYWIPKWVGDILFMMVDEAAHQAGTAIGTKAGNLLGPFLGETARDRRLRNQQTALRNALGGQAPDDSDCVICLDQAPPDSPRPQGPYLCGINGAHAFHEACIRRWIEDNHYNCPTCNGNFLQRNN